MRRAATLACLLIPLCLAACNRDAPPTDAVPTPDAAPAPWANDPSALRIETDVRKLADAAMEGRDNGTRGYRMASAYVAERFAGIGLQPAGADGPFFQAVPLLKAKPGRVGARFRSEPRPGGKEGSRPGSARL